VENGHRGISDRIQEAEVRMEDCATMIDQLVYLLKKRRMLGPQLEAVDLFYQVSALGEQCEYNIISLLYISVQFSENNIFFYSD
jgi:hypothetical protein